MFSACNLAYDGIEKNMDDFSKKMSRYSINPSEEQYRELIAPLGNALIGNRVIKHYCEDFLIPQKIKKSNYYKDKIKEDLSKIDNLSTMNERELDRLKQNYGLMGGKKVVFYNVDGIPIKDVEFRDLYKEIFDFETQNPYKNAIWKNKITQSFEKWMKKND